MTPETTTLDSHARDLGERLVDKLCDLGAPCQLDQIVLGAQTIRYVVTPADGVLVRSLPRLAPEIAFELAVESASIIAPLPGRRAVAVDVPNPWRRSVPLEGLPSPSRPLAFALGVDSAGSPVECDLAAMPHLLVAGFSGAGKSTFLHSMLCSLLARNSPDDLGLVLIDPKRVELSRYRSLPHLICPLLDEPHEVGARLRMLVEFMDDRYEEMRDLGVRDIDEHNAVAARRMLRIVVVVDELADLMMVAKDDVEEPIARLAQKGRAAGIHLILATQTPRVAVVTGLIKANVSSRLAFTCSSMTDSRVILDRGGAERLLGRGDALFLPGDAANPIRVQCAVASDDLIARTIDAWSPVTA